MYIHAIPRNATFLADMPVSFQGLEALFIPVGTIVTICTTLPAMMILASVMLPKAFAAAIEVCAFWSSHAREWLTAVFTGEGRSLADMQSLFFGDASALANLTTKALLGMGFPIRAILSKESFAAKVTNNRYKFACLFSRFMLTFTRTIDTLFGSSVEEGLVTDRTDILGAGNCCCHFHTSGSMSWAISGGAFPRMNACQRVASPLKP